MTRKWEKQIMKIFFGFFLCLIIMGCSAINKGLDKTAEGAKELGKPLGKMTNAQQAISEGAVEGAMETEKAKDENPFNR